MMEEEKIYAELAFILEQLPYSYSKLIPSNIIDKIKTEMSVEWYLKFDKDKVFYKQNIPCRAWNCSKRKLGGF